MKSILDRNFRYTSSAETDLRKTFARVRREQRVVDRAPPGSDPQTKLKVTPLRREGHNPLLKHAPGKL